MHLSALTVGLVGFVVLIVFAAILILRSHGRKRYPSSRITRGPDNLHFVCAGCGGQFTHTKRTVAAWEKGSRRFFCNSCHKSWRQAQPANPAQPAGPAQPAHPVRAEPAARPAGVFSQESSRSRGVSNTARHVGSGRRSGCLTVLVVLVVLPITIYVVARYA